MKLVIRYSAIIFSFVLIFYSCSDLRNNIDTTAPELSPHQEGFTTVGSPNFHGNVIRQNNWSMAECIKCHAADFRGGTTGQSCYECHKQEAGPKACNTCHGDFSDSTKIAPPRDTHDNTMLDLRTVGAHTSHLYTNSLSIVSCSTCHTVPKTADDPGHIDDPPAEVKLTGLAVINIASNAKYDPKTLTCSNTYCHGNFEFKKSDAIPENQFIYTSDKMTGNNVTVTWNNLDSDQAACGSCHGLPPPGHIDVPLSTCYYCHAQIVDQSGHIIDQSKHIDGKITITSGISPAKMQQLIPFQLNKKAAQ